MKTPICERLGCEVPIFAFTHCRDVVVEVTKAGGFGVLGAVGFSPEQRALYDVTLASQQACLDATKPGATLDALQFVLNKILNRTPESRRHIVVDSGDYRERHEQGLVTLAKREAKRAVTEGRTITLQPMSARDRRVIHLSLAKLVGVTTMSQGEGAQRRIQIIPQRRRSAR